MTNLIDFIIDLFRNDSLGRAFVADPTRTLADAGLSHVSAAQLGAVAATVVPEVGLRGGDPINGLQQAVSQQFDDGGVTPLPATQAFASGNDLLSDIPIDTEASHNDTEVHDNTTQLGSHNMTELASPDFTFGDFVLGDQNSASGDGAVAVSGTASGDIVSGEGAVLGNDNEVDNGTVQTGSNSNIAYGDGSEIIQENIDRHEDSEQLASSSDAAPYVLGQSGDPDEQEDAQAPADNLSGSDDVSGDTTFDSATTTFDPFG